MRRFVLICLGILVLALAALEVVASQRTADLVSARELRAGPTWQTR